MKRGRAGSKDNLDVDKEEKQPEFVQVKLKKSVVKTASSFDSATTGPSNELKKKLAKQKSVAEGIDEKPEVTFIKPKEKQPVPLPTKNKDSTAVAEGVTNENNNSDKVINTDKTDGSTPETSPPGVTKETKEDTKVNNNTTDQPPCDNNNDNKIDTEKTPESSVEAKPESQIKVEDKEKEDVKTEKEENINTVTPETGTTSDKTKEIDAVTPQIETKPSVTEEKVASETTPKKLKDRSASWEAEMILDATGRAKTDEEEAKQKALNGREAAKKEYRKSVDDVFDGLLNDMIVSIDTASEGSGAARKSSRPSIGGSDAPV